ncbi:hypothetical protein BSZ39_02460 [Bowdeniella nasicola]|uniref:N-acetyltransferase domain-containing protein n=1 Tax=Bowdeniella nasicola TaxID=208480 RepID=A0A1Q5Q4L4_9ACTO|nr:GNAT family protein [Bowdeniella nasicola]OKL54765.1 hypothetical protein BSZ39_02460 [Bowdeniella nasicola]
MHVWPTVLTHEDLTLRPVRARDERAWARVRGENRYWLEPWDVADPYGARSHSFRSWARHFRRQGRAGNALPFVLEIGEDPFAGQVMASPITYGAARTAVIGYWISRDYAGRGYMPRAVALTCDYLFDELGINRIEINVRPENHPSLRVVEKLGFPEEGIARGLLYIDGEFRDHRRFAMLSPDRPPGGLISLFTS